MTAEQLAGALIRGPITPLRLRKFVRLATQLNPAVVTGALAAIPDAGVRAQVADALRAAGLEG